MEKPRIKTAWAGLLLLSLAIAVMAAYLVRQSVMLRRYCEAIPLGQDQLELRRSAEAEGFKVDLEPYAQLRITPRFWHPARPSCLVALDVYRKVGFRSWQDHR